MSNPYFQFKQFRVYHDLCAMKVTQDACVFGASIAIGNAQNILDIGCGSGILSLMLAQRTSAHITALDIDQGAIDQTQLNISQSPFEEDQFTLLKQDVKDYKGNRFDLIVCNPPYYTDQDQSNSTTYNQARHSNASLNFEDLAETIASLLSEEGKFWFILPIYEYQKLLKALKHHQLFPNELIESKHNEQAKNARMIVSVSHKELVNTEVSNLHIREEDNNYTDAFKFLMRDYYIKF